MSHSSIEAKETLSNGFSDKIDENIEKWRNFSNWIHCICVVTFDLELGQALEVLLNA